MAVTTQQLTQWKQQGRTIVALTAWDYAIAQLLDVAGVDLILVGDSLAVILGYETTLPITSPSTSPASRIVCARIGLEMKLFSEGIT